MQIALINFKLFFQNASEKGILLLIACTFALIISNSNFAPLYNSVLNLSVFQVESLGIHLNVFHFTNDFLMAIFFLLVGADIKREVLFGHLSTPKERVLPVVAAIGGVITPILLYLCFTYNHPDLIRGWAIPAATDIAFSLGVLALFGKGLPVSLRVFLTALAIIDDLIALVIIALFYSSEIHGAYLAMVLLTCLAVYFKPNKENACILTYVVYGFILWFCFYKSGIHSTIAGVTLAILIPSAPQTNGISMLERIERKINPWVLYLILPLFAFINSGVTMGDNFLEYLFHPVALGIMVGLFVGKQLGIFSTTYILIKLGIASMPKGTSFKQLYGVAVMCGIGFTMSLFVGHLSFTNDETLLNQVRIGVLSGSLLSAIGGAIILKFFCKRN
jgi:Na+:H+ antiporter, NhaA family